MEILKTYLKEIKVNFVTKVAHEKIRMPQVKKLSLKLPHEST